MRKYPIGEWHEMPKDYSMDLPYPLKGTISMQGKHGQDHASKKHFRRGKYWMQVSCASNRGLLCSLVLSKPRRVNNGD